MHRPNLMDNYIDDYSWAIWRDRYFSQCKNCRWTQRIWRNSFYVVHPVSGWWERANMIFRNRKLRIDYILHKGFVKFVDEADDSFCDDDASVLSI